MKNKILEQLGKNIQLLRKQKGYSQEEFAEKIGIATNTLSSIERGFSFMTVQTLEKISLTLKVPPHELFFASDENEEKDMYNYILKKLNDIKNDSNRLNILYKLVKALL
ncbi:helix-turn-helix transcriptional regulator [bacterium]|nr:helix-turn-helix transcriptional regulator [bacterium]